MTTVSTHTTREEMRGRFGIRLSVVAFVALTMLAIPVASASGAGTTSLRSVKTPGFFGALATSSSKSLYLLTSEKGAALKCTGACLSTWLPLLVKDSVATITLGTGVKGTVGFVARGAKMKQVTYNSYPVYTFAGDSGVRGNSGEGLVFKGGTWFLVKAVATSSTKTPFKSTPTTTTTTVSGATTTNPAPTTTTTKPAPTTTTTSPGGIVY